jgi:hypothetical protein
MAACVERERERRRGEGRGEREKERLEMDVAPCEQQRRVSHEKGAAPPHSERVTCARFLAVDALQLQPRRRHRSFSLAAGLLTLRALRRALPRRWLALSAQSERPFSVPRATRPLSSRPPSSDSFSPFLKP